MELLITLNTDSKETFKDFRQWLFNVLGKDANKLKSIEKSTIKFQLPYLIQYLESKDVNILTILPYYNCLSSNQALNFEQLLTFATIEEFKRIELKKTIDYVPF